MQKKARQALGASATDSLAPHYPIESVDKALKLLLLLGEQPEIRLSEATRYLGVAFAIFGRIDIAGTVTPIMGGLSERLRETVHVGMLDGAAVRFAAAVEGPTAVRVASRLGHTDRSIDSRAKLEDELSRIRRWARHCIPPPRWPTTNAPTAHGMPNGRRYAPLPGEPLSQAPSAVNCSPVYRSIRHRWKRIWTVPMYLASNA
jgi:hypothetical protein